MQSDFTADQLGVQKGSKPVLPSVVTGEKVGVIPSPGSVLKNKWAKSAFPTNPFREDRIHE